MEDRIKFKSFFLLKRIFPLNEIYQEATNPQIEEFCSHASLHVESVESFKEQADQVVRKLVSAISRSDILSEMKVDDIKKIAIQMGIPIEVQNGRIVMPALRKELKIMLRFLDDKIYEAPLTKYKYMTNSAKLLA